MSTHPNYVPAVFPTLELNGHGLLELTNPGMTLRQYAAIKLRIPVSGDEWLDEMIRESLRNDLAAKAMQGLLAAWGSHDVTSFSELSSDAYQMAGAMLEESEGGAV